MAKKYLSIEEACNQLGVTTDEMNRLREGGEIRGFSDRGTWKFKPEDVDELGRSRQADSSPSVPILDSDVDLGDSEGEGSSVVLGEPTDGSSVLLSEEEDDVGQQPTIIRKAGDALADMSGSDSDVRLVLDESLTEDSTSDVAVPKKPDSDSDVRLVEDKPSDSDVKLVSDASDSDVRLAQPVEGAATDSDSDVQLVGDASHSDIVLGSPAAETGSDSDVKLIGSDVGTDEDIALAPLAGDSGPVQADPDSGISLEAAVDSGISLMSEEDSGISLAADSGISLDMAGDSGIALEALNEAGPGAADLEETQFELEALEDDSEFELAQPASGKGSDTGVIVFDDEAGVDDFAPTMVRPEAETDDDFGSGAFEFDDDLEVAEDVVGEDDELDDIDVFDAGDEDFAESFEGESHAEFISPGAIAAPVQQEWGVGPFLGLILTSALMILCCVVMFDFVRSIWAWKEPSGFSSALMKQIGGLFGK